jgi:hypothetical protein
MLGDDDVVVVEFWKPELTLRRFRPLGCDFTRQVVPAIRMRTAGANLEEGRAMLHVQFPF